MQENRLEKLINEDKESRKFWETLPEGLQNKLSGNVDGFTFLKRCVDSGMSFKDIHENWEDFNYYNPASSANDCTGLIPSGDNLTNEEFWLYRGIYPLGNPPQK